LIVFLVDPRDIELVLSSQVYLEKSPEYRFFRPWLGNGLLISSGEFIDFHGKYRQNELILNLITAYKARVWQIF